MFIGIRDPCDNVNFCGMIKNQVLARFFSISQLTPRSQKTSTDHCNELTENHTAFGRTSLYLFATEKTRFWFYYT